MKTETHWKKIGKKSHHGICLPLFSLRTEKSCGIGEFLDLIPLIEWCKHLGFDCLQLLPLNDTGYDPSPYNPLSSCALDPIYLSLHDLPNRDAGFDRFLPFKDSLRLCRTEVKKLKLEWLRSYFERTFSALSSTSSYLAFLAESPWLSEYSRFMANKSTFQGKHWQEWPSDLKESEQEIDFHNFLQYHSFSQLKKVGKFARERSVFLIGDTPHLLSPDSADVWAHPSLFQLDLEAGAPPDKYNPLGQKWGFPLFDWNAMQKDHDWWWKRRLSTLAKLYHMYRIDHVVGFFRIWAVAHEKNPMDGSFVPADPVVWADHGRRILEMMIDHCPLLPLAEDLGTIPPEVFPILKNLGICGTKILRWQGNTPYNEYEPFSMTTVSTPDMEPLPLWWQKYPEEAKSLCAFKGWSYEPDLSGERQVELLRDAHHTSSYFHINLLQEYLFPFPELYGASLEDERINVPGTLLPTNWTYRFRPTLEEMRNHEPLSRSIRAILTPLPIGSSQSMIVIRGSEMQIKKRKPYTSDLHDPKGRTKFSGREIQSLRRKDFS